MRGPVPLSHNVVDPVTSFNVDRSLWPSPSCMVLQSSLSLRYLCVYQQSYQHYHHLVQQCLLFRQAILNMQHYTLSSVYYPCNNVTMPSQLIVFHTCIVSVSPRPHMSISPSKRTQSPRQGLSLCLECYIRIALIELIKLICEAKAS